MNRRVLVCVFVPILLLSVLATFNVWAPNFTHFLLRVRVVEGGRGVECRVFVQAFYPDGFRNIYVGDSKSGEFDVLVDVNDLRSAWDRERELTGCYAQPSFSIVVFTNKSLDDRIISFDWGDFKPVIYGGVKVVEITPRFTYNETISEEEAASPLEETPPYPPVELVDSYQMTMRVTLMKVETSANSRAHIQVGYEAGRTVKVGVDIFLFSVGQWDIGGFLGLSSTKTNSAAGMVYENSVGRISMEATYRFEHWIYRSGSNIIREEYKVFWCNFKPETIEYESGEDAKVNYETIAIKHGTGFSSAMYSEMSSIYVNYESGVDAGFFIDILSRTLKKIKPVAAVLSLIIDLKLTWESYAGLMYGFAAYGSTGRLFYIDKGASQWSSLYKVSYYKIRE